MVWAQQQLQKSWQSKASAVVASFGKVNTITVKNSDTKNGYRIHVENDADLAATIKVEEQNGTIYIRGIENLQWQEELMHQDKQCTIQPLYNSYTIEIPRFKKIDLTCVEGNIITNHLVAHTNIQLDEGFITLNKPELNYTVKIHTGKVSGNISPNTKVMAQSRIGVIKNLTQNEGKKSSDGTVNLTVGQPKNLVNIKAISASIELIMVN